MKKLATLLALLSLFLYPSCYWICELFFENEIVKWRLLRDTLKGVELISVVVLYFLPKTRISRSAMYSLLVLCAGNMIDRLFFGVSVFVWTDFFLIAFAVMVFIIKYKGHGNKGRLD